MHFLCKTVKL